MEPLVTTCRPRFTHNEQLHNATSQPVAPTAKQANKHTFRALGDELRFGDVRQRHLLLLRARVSTEELWDRGLEALADARPDRDELHGAIATTAVGGAVSIRDDARDSSPSESGAAAAAASRGGVRPSVFSATSATAAGPRLAHGRSVTRARSLTHSSSAFPALILSKVAMSVRCSFLVLRRLYCCFSSFVSSNTNDADFGKKVV